MVNCILFAAGAPTVLNFLKAGGVGPVASMHGHYVLHIHGQVFDAQSFVLTDEEYGLQLEDFRRHVSKVAQYRHLIGVGVGTGFLDSHFLAVWEDQRQLQLADQQVHTWNHYLLLRMADVQGFQHDIVASTSHPNPDQPELRSWIQQHLKIIIYGQYFEELTPFLKHVAIAAFVP